jgi:small subunit ribosomal protein S12
MMVSLNQLIINSRVTKLKKSSSPRLNQNPQKKAVCLRVLTISPKKPNSANRRILKSRVANSKIKLIAKIPGESHNLQQHSTVLLHGSKVRDLIGVNYSAIRGKYDLLGVINRKQSRSRYGVKKS